jgi:hypothetical protein
MKRQIFDTLTYSDPPILLLVKGISNIPTLTGLDSLLIIEYHPWDDDILKASSLTEDLKYGEFTDLFHYCAGL